MGGGALIYYHGFTAGAVAGIRLELEKTVEKYNTFRPHKNFGGFTLMQYTQNIEANSQFYMNFYNILA